MNFDTQRLGRTGKGSHGWTSRDYNIDVPCDRITCPANNGAKGLKSHNFCSMPSAIKIGANGICKTGQSLIEAQPPQTPKRPIDGD